MPVCLWESVEDQLFVPVMELLQKAQDAVTKSGGKKFFTWAPSRSTGLDYPAPDLRWCFPAIQNPAKHDCTTSGSRSLQAMLTSLIRLSFPGDHIGVDAANVISEMTVERAVGSCVEMAFCTKRTGIASCVFMPPSRLCYLADINAGQHQVYPILTFLSHSPSVTVLRIRIFRHFTLLQITRVVSHLSFAQGKLKKA